MSLCLPSTFPIFVLTYMAEIAKFLLIEDTSVLVFRSKQNTSFSFFVTFFVLEIPFLPGFYWTGFLFYFLSLLTAIPLKSIFSSSTISSPVFTDCQPQLCSLAPCAFDVMNRNISVDFSCRLKFLPLTSSLFLSFYIFWDCYSETNYV